MDADVFCCCCCCCWCCCCCCCCGPPSATSLTRALPALSASALCRLHGGSRVSFCGKRRHRPRHRIRSYCQSFCALVSCTLIAVRPTSCSLDEVMFSPNQRVHQFAWEKGTKSHVPWMSGPPPVTPNFAWCSPSSALNSFNPAMPFLSENAMQNRAPRLGSQVGL